MLAGVNDMQHTETSLRRSGSETRQRPFVARMRCTAAEHAQLEAAAERAGMSVGAFMRHQCLGNAGPRAARRPPVERAALAQLGRCGGNLNQIARALNSGDRAPAGTAEAAAAFRDACAVITRMLGRSES